jgi:outer membrane lipoprotein-sorting protein
MTRLERWLRYLLISATLLAVPALHAAELQLEDLMQQLAQVKSAKARFVERKFMAVLDNKPVESSGELSFTAPDRMEMRTLKPRPQGLRLEGERLTLEQFGRQRSIQLSAYPEIGAFIEGIRGTLAGDKAALEQFYEVQLTGQLARWQLQLVPRESRMSRWVNRIRISGNQANVTQVTYEQTDGDRSEMQITPITEP